ncbi:MAG: hypothetical protein V1729_01180 [Candidatus Woesearchaeota archaeon]
MILLDCIGEEEKQRLRKSSEHLDSRINAVNSQAEQICAQLTGYAVASEESFNEFISSERLDRFVDISRKEFPFSQKYSPDITFNRLIWETSFDRLPRVIPLGLERRIRRFRMRCDDYSDGVADMGSSLSRYALEQNGLYNELADLTVLEMPFRQDIKNDSVILYVNDPKTGVLYKADIYLLSGDGEKSEWSFMSPEMLYVPTTISRLRREAKAAGSNLYFLNNPSDKMRADWLVEYAIDELRMEHFGLPPLTHDLQADIIGISAGMVMYDPVQDNFPEYIVSRGPDKYALGFIEGEPDAKMMGELMEAPSSKRMH